ncbi:hypothetical protein [Nocardioides jensenii]|uniref:hypothetical protein n=1 Tax=Nocardioides jensenii TaxID=1843 RepID=UPI000832D651|nr:hypothetical protein [Nocardioides jensenii]
MSSPEIARPAPSWRWRYRWQWRGRSDVHGLRETTVCASFSTNEADADGLPNEIVVVHMHGEGRTRETVRMNREAASMLIDQLRAALQWDGK